MGIQMNASILIRILVPTFSIVSCSFGQAANEPPLSVYDKFFQDINRIIAATPDSIETFCPPFSGPPLDYRYIQCYGYRGTVNLNEVFKRLTTKGYTVTSDIGPNSLRIYEKKGERKYYSLAALDKIDDTVLVGYISSANGGFVGSGKGDAINQHLELTLPEAARQVALKLNYMNDTKVACFKSSVNSYCVTFKDKQKLLSRLADMFYAGPEKNFFNKMNGGNFFYKGEERWKTEAEGLGDMTVDRKKLSIGDQFDLKNSLIYTNMIFSALIQNDHLEVIARWRPGYTPVPYPPKP